MVRVEPVAEGDPMSEPTVVVMDTSETPEPGVFPALANSINEAFGPTLEATIESGQLVIRTQEIAAMFSVTGKLVGADVSATTPP
jgi:hypothetical protein